jgi:hypothetical protein
MIGRPVHAGTGLALAMGAHHDIVAVGDGLVPANPSEVQRLWETSQF